MQRVIDAERFPEWQPFVDAVRQRRPDTGTWCEAWTVRDIVIHQAGNAEELARVLGAHLGGEPVGTRGFEEREGPLRDLDDADLWDALLDRMATLNDVAAAADEVSPDTDVAWTGRTMKVPWFAEHMREELVLHGWDITGDDEAARARLAEPWMTTHSVLAVGRPLLAKGVKQLRAGERIAARLRVAGADDVVLDAQADHTTIGFAEPEGPATLETDAAARVLLLWGRRPADPARIRSSVGPETLGRLRLLLSGY
ncbi:maleylpyruvate isomerase N-terminal domain-containing protein [Mycobacterium sp. Aquia_213]|uniref:maleylpyruvate isomerase N-terminal domain-containing protein n=1 Tax=Mycobacterium sp. Aquia_213 TaxID=2991728 RepID=UPI00226DB476|nr:maleylpyruvate isomerase N-terminal domain-containing protein [Mycobacterium sp. Aquia_213]WAC92825.1 maleylpyruvate isomerase N-terminal domain-containing protein [Mycobacterium sp. Aquia_213]